VLDCASKLLGRDDNGSLETGPGGIREKSTSELLLSYAALAQQIDDASLPCLDLEVEEAPGTSRIEAAHYIFGACAALAKVRVDTWTGAVKVANMLLVPGLGPVVSAQGFAGQMEGGAVMGLGMALLEELPAIGGDYTARNFDRYFMPTLLDAPNIELIAVEDVLPGDTIGPRGAGEISLNAAAPAIANALADALGGGVVALPVLPADVLAILAKEKPP
jgi:CO/xanthine dehydrogenase Mo-binding subunit